MLKVRLQRRGKRNYATFRVVVADAHAPIKGKFIADLGFYNPHTNEFRVHENVVHEWLAHGAKPSATVHNLLITHDVIKGEKVTSWRPKKKSQEEQPQQAAPETGKTEKQEGQTAQKQ